MITYDHLWWIKSTYDGWRRLKTSFRSVGGLFGPLSQPKNLKIRPRKCFFIARLTIKLPDLEIPLKSRKIRKNLIFEKSNFRNRWKNDLTIFSGCSFSKGIRIQTQNPISTKLKGFLNKIFIFMFWIKLYREGTSL